METSTREAVRDLLVHVHAGLAAHRLEIDELNVFPVPDGDTGTNMTRTVAAALDAVDAADEDADAVAAAVDGAVRGGRGNSGVILSQVLRAWLVAGLHAPSGSPTVAEAMSDARQLAFGAVARPVDGTVLTVAAHVERVALEHADEPVPALLERLADAADGAVARTPEQLDVLARAGKVDAGGRGLAVALRALARRSRGEDPALVPSDERDVATTVGAGTGAAGGHDRDGGADRLATIHDLDGPVDPDAVADDAAARDDADGPADDEAYDGPRWEVMYVVPGDDDAVDDLRTTLTGVGDSVAVVGTGKVVQVHVHTDDIGAALEVGLAHGTPADVRVEDLRDRPCGPDVAAARAARKRERTEARPTVDRTNGPGALLGATGGASPAEPREHVRGVVDGLGLVTVLPPGALQRLAREHGAVVVDGAAGSLPSVADVLNAVGLAGGGEVAVLPGHPNVVPTARQASRVSEMEGGRAIAIVEEADSPPRVLAGLAVLTPGSTPAEAIAGLREVAAAVRSGEVVAAVRSAETPAGRVEAGDLLAVVDGDVVHAGDDPVEAVLAAVTALADDGVELVTLLAGGDTEVAERLAVADAVASLDLLGDAVEVEVLDGGMRPSRWFIGLE